MDLKYSLKKQKAKSKIPLFADRGLPGPVSFAKLGTYLDVSSFETPFSYYGRMSSAKELIILGISKNHPKSSVLPCSYLTRKKRTKSLK